MRFEFVLKGRTALLLHHDDVIWSDNVSAWRLNPANKKQKGEAAGDDRRPAFTWIGSLYSDGTHVTIPSANLQSCMKTAGKRVPLDARRSFKEIAVSGLFFESEFLDFTTGGKQIPVAAIQNLMDEPKFAKHTDVTAKLGFKLDVRRAPIGQSKHVRVRPRFDNWQLSGTLEVTDDRITSEVLADLFEQAGRCGLGDWRPSSPRSPGSFGMFSSTIRKIK